MVFSVIFIQKRVLVIDVIRGDFKMRKIAIVLLITMIFVSACNEESGSKKEESKDEIVQVIIPFRFYDGVSQEQVLQQAEELGISKTTINEEERLVEYEMSGATQDDISEDLEKNLQKFIEELKTNEDLTSIKDIENNKEFNYFTVIVDRELYEADGNSQGYAILGLLLRTLYYHYFNGEDYKTYEVNVDIKDKDTNEVFDTIVFPGDDGGF